MVGSKYTNHPNDHEHAEDTDSSGRPISPTQIISRSDTQDTTESVKLDEAETTLSSDIVSKMLEVPVLVVERKNQVRTLFSNAKKHYSVLSQKGTLIASLAESDRKSIRNSEFKMLDRYDTHIATVRFSNMRLDVLGADAEIIGEVRRKAFTMSRKYTLYSRGSQFAKMKFDSLSTLPLINGSGAELGKVVIETPDQKDLRFARFVVEISTPISYEQRIIVLAALIYIDHYAPSAMSKLQQAPDPPDGI